MTKSKNYIKITDSNPNFKGYNLYMYVDVKEKLAKSIFREYDVQAQRLKGVYKKDDCKYILNTCRIPKSQNAAFIKSMNALYEQMFLVGHSDYEEFCGNLSQAIKI